MPSGFVTARLAEPASVGSAAGMLAVTCVLLTKVVARGEPFHNTTAPDVKLLPPTVSVNAPLPAGRAYGLKLVTVGGGPVTALAALIRPVCQRMPVAPTSRSAVASM